MLLAKPQLPFVNAASLTTFLTLDSPRQARLISSYQDPEFISTKSLLTEKIIFAGSGDEDMDLFSGGNSAVSHAWSPEIIGFK